MSKLQMPPVSLSADVRELVDTIIERNPLHASFLQRSVSDLNERDLSNLQAYIAFCRASGMDLDYLADCYLTIVTDTLREQVYFNKHKKYRHASFQDVAGDVYFNVDYMSKYMYGLAITGYFWPNHRKIIAFFRESLPNDQSGKYLEIGPGHGCYFLMALEESSYEQLEGVDISETSAKLTRDIVAHRGADAAGKANIVLKDFLETNLPANSCDAVVMGEVLEHVESPQRFMERIAKVARQDAYIFVTTCCNAPAIDHIYLFDSPAEVEQLFTDAHLTVRESLILPLEGQSLEQCAEQKLPVNVAYVLAKN